MVDFVIKDGMSKYKILLPKRASEREKFASEELRFFLCESSGLELEICTDISEEQKYISVGETLQKQLLEKTNNVLGSDGYEIVTLNGNYFIYGGSDYGTAYAVYGLCKELFDLEIYSGEDYTFTKGDIPCKDINLVDIPDIPIRTLGIHPYHDEEINPKIKKRIFRMKLRGMADGWGICSHSYFKILPPSIYFEKHRDWYSSGDGGINLCLTNSDMQEEFVFQLKKIVESNPNAEYFMLGQEDSASFCNCKNCTEVSKKYNGKNSVLMMQFTNSVVKQLNKWLKTVYPNRNKVIFCMFAYQQTIIPPVVWDENVGEFLQQFDFEIEGNLGVMLAPLATCATTSYFNDNNMMSFDKKYNSELSAKTADIINGWRAVVDNIFFWSYSMDFVDFFVPYSMWDTVQENYKGYKKLGIKYIFEEGAYSHYVPNWNELRSYLFANLMWNCALSIEQLQTKFFVNFYGENSLKPMQEYFELLRSHIDIMTRKFNRPMFYVRFDDFDDLSSKKFWDLSYLTKAVQLHDEATCRAVGTPYYNHVFAEGTGVKYLLINNYKSELSQSDYKRYICDVGSILKDFVIADLKEGFQKENLENIIREYQLLDAERQ